MLCRSIQTSNSTQAPSTAAASMKVVTDRDTSSTNEDAATEVPSTELNRINTEEELRRFSKSSLPYLLAQGIEAFEDVESKISDYSKYRKQSTVNDLNGSATNQDKNIDTKPNFVELLQKFDPNNPPKPKLGNDTDSAENNDTLNDLQLWFECESQQDSMKNIQDMIQSARDRQDYGSMSTVQKQFLRWYEPLVERIKEEQKDYFINGGRTGRKDAVKYGPYLCTLQPEKLAILACREATLFALKRGGTAKYTNMANAIGEAVESEVNVQRLLKQRFDEQRLKRRMERQEADDITSNAEDGTDVGISVAQNEQSGDGVAKVNNNNVQKRAITPLNDGINRDWMYGPSHLQKFFDEIMNQHSQNATRRRTIRASKRAQELLESSERWTSVEKIKLGAALIAMILDTATVRLSGRDEVPAFMYSKRWINDKKLVGHIDINHDFYKLVVEDKLQSFDPYTDRFQPMVVPPKKWESPTKGGYLALSVDLMRTHGCDIQKDALHKANLSDLYDGLNALGRVPWKINRTTLDVAQKCWDDGVVIGDIPSRIDLEVPPMPIRPENNQNKSPDKNNPAYEKQIEEYKKYRDAVTKHRRLNQKNMDLRSLRCSVLLKLNQAEKMKQFEKIYFPYSVDFRGRAYPVPPHLSNVGSDLSRGLLRFASSKPLGPRGLYWLKVHLANLAGADKMSFDERASFTDENMDNVRACTEDPFSEKGRWWMSLDSPFQALATCHEIIAAIDSGDPEMFESSLPVHMDGSCNGLQHYAALGRDIVGGKAVNLCDCDKPQDVYVRVMDEVILRVAEEAAQDLDFEHLNPEDLSKSQRDALRKNRAAKLVNNLIDRGVVKRTVMTSVYGVTFIGAKAQIQEKIEEKLEEQGYDIDEIDHEIHSACTYLARTTMDVMGDLFTGARSTMNWLAASARLIASTGQPVSWMTPIGVPAVQPYRKKQSYLIVTLLQTVVLVNNSDNLPIHKQRQQTAFSPNYVHSLDSSHMLLTALEMERRGLTFSAVHDSFWTHPCDIDEMNDVLRDCFIELYNRPLLEDLKETWELQYPSLTFPELPELGSLDLNDVRDARYFFQ